MPPKDTGSGKAKGGRIIKTRFESPPPDENSLRARKRTMDREAQRNFRANTKSYIAHLEQTIKACEANSESQRVAQLLAENESIYNTLKRMRRILNDVFSTIQPELKRQNRLTIGEEETRDPIATDSQQQASTIFRATNKQPQPDSVLLDPSDLSMSSNSGTGRLLQDAIPSVALDDLLNEFPAGIHAAGTFNQGIQINQNLIAEKSSLEQIPQHQCAQNRLVMPSNVGQSPVDQQNYNGLETREFRLTLPRRPSAFCFWAHANMIYSQIFTIMPGQTSAVSSSDRNLLFKAIKCGWQSLESECNNNTVLQILRCYDSLVTNVFDPIDRLAIAYKNYPLIQYLLNRDFIDLLRIPEWQRPSMCSARAGEYPLLIDFFPWPSLREKMINGQLQVDQFTFGRAFLSNFRFDWPFALEDTYQYCAASDVYSSTSMFERYHQDLKVWTMGESFFWQFPQLVGDIGIYSG